MTQENAESRTTASGNQPCLTISLYVDDWQPRPHLANLYTQGKNQASMYPSLIVVCDNRRANRYHRRWREIRARCPRGSARLAQSDRRKRSRPWSGKCIRLFFFLFRYSDWLLQFYRNYVLYAMGTEVLMFSSVPRAAASIPPQHLKKVATIIIKKRHGSDDDIILDFHKQLNFSQS